jgi:hypothetical protein
MRDRGKSSLVTDNQAEHMGDGMAIQFMLMTLFQTPAAGKLS